MTIVDPRTKPATSDLRVTPARGDIAAAHLRGVVEAMRFVDGTQMQIGIGRTALRNAPSDTARRDSELLFGERFIVYESVNGWAWGQAPCDSYVGYVRADALCTPEPAPTHRVTALGTPVLYAPDIKSAARDMLPMNAQICVRESAGHYARIGESAFVYARHLAALDTPAPDWVAVAQRFIGVPYVWGGKTSAGLDCSGLIQLALQAAGTNPPRDADMQEAAIGTAVDCDARFANLQRGDLVFWDGHVGVMVDADMLLHANAFHMEVACEPLAQAAARIAQTAGPVTSIKRL